MEMMKTESAWQMARYATCAAHTLGKKPSTIFDHVWSGCFILAD